MTRMGQACAGDSPRTRAARRALAVAVAVWTGIAVPVAARDAVQPAAGADAPGGVSLSQVEARVVVPGGATVVVVPVRAVGVEPAPGVLIVRVPGGGQVEARLAPVDLMAPAVVSEAEAWTGLVGSWQVGEHDVRAGAIRRDWLVVIDGALLDGAEAITLPGDIEVALLRAGDVAAGARVLAGAAARAVADAPGGATIDRARSAALLAPALAAPAERWRARALAHAPGQPVGGGDRAIGPGVVRSADAPPDVLRALADQIEAAWLGALARLAQADEPLAARVADALVRCVRFDGGVLAPVWPAAAASDVRLGALLDPRAAPEALRIAARAWLDAQPPALAWVIDDAGRPLRDTDDDANAGSHGARAVIGLANLTGAPAVAWLVAANAGRSDEDNPEAQSDEPLLLEAHGAAMPEVMMHPPQSAAAPSVARIRVGQVETSLGVRVSPMPVMPPGAMIGPLQQDWSAASLLLAGGGGLAQAPPPAPWTQGARADAWLTAARLTREGDAWVLLVQCNHEAGAPLEREQLEVWMGAHGAREPVRISPPAAHAPDAAGTPARVHMTTTPGAPVGSWWATITVPASAAEPGGTLRLGLVRTDSRAVRSSWPRAMLPWQTEPGRAVFDVSAWDGGAP